jgi:2-oxoglutarate dehydrogenase E2 component (dihydrolipoamide succinyltransferase)
MSVELKVPAVGESITEVQIGDWLKQSGDSVAADEPVVVIETDKVTVELPAPAAGRIGKQLKRKGDTATVGEVIGYLEEGAAAKKSDEPVPKATPAAARAQAAPVAAQATAAPKDAAKEKIVMPAAARELAQRGLTAREVTASGPGGRVLKEDVVSHDAQPASKPASAPVAPASAAAPAPAAPVRDDQAATAPAKARASGSRDEEVVPMTPLRKRIAERLVQAQKTAAILTTFNEIDMSAVMALRKQHQESFQARYGIKLGFMSFFVKGAVEALKLVPQVNAEIRGDAIAYRNYMDIGIAVGGGKGLVVPILRNAERMSFAEVEIAIADISARARDNKIALEELQGGTFTISNGGIYGSLLSTPILNPPQSGILGLHAIQDRVVARDGQVVIRPMMYVALSYDHRLVDGREAVTFLKRIKECVEDPARMLIEA